MDKVANHYLVGTQTNMSEWKIESQRIQRISIEDTKRGKNFRVRFFLSVLLVE